EQRATWIATNAPGRFGLSNPSSASLPGTLDPSGFPPGELPVREAGSAMFALRRPRLRSKACSVSGAASHAEGDVTSAPNASTRTYFGVSDRSGLRRRRGPVLLDTSLSLVSSPPWSLSIPNHASLRSRVGRRAVNGSALA